MDTPVETDITGTRKTIVLSIVGVVLTVVLIGTFVPSIHEYVVVTSKMLLGAVPMFIK